MGAPASVRNNQMEPTRYTMIRRFADGIHQTQDWKDFYDIYRRPILAIAQKEGFDRAECEDILQETAVEMVKGGFRRYDSALGHRFSSYLFGVARLLSKSARRKRSARIRFMLKTPNEDSEWFWEEGITDSADGPVELAEITYFQTLVCRLLELFVERKIFQERTVLCAYSLILDECTPQEASVKHGYSSSLTGPVPNNVYECKRTVVEALRIALRALDDGDGLEAALGQIEAARRINREKRKAK